MLLLEITELLKSAYSWIKKANIDLDRKVLASLAVNDKEAFSLIAEQAKSNLAVIKFSL